MEKPEHIRKITNMEKRRLRYNLIAIFRKERGMDELILYSLYNTPDHCFQRVVGNPLVEIIEQHFK